MNRQKKISAVEKVTFAVLFSNIYRSHYGKIGVILRRKWSYNANFNQ